MNYSPCAGYGSQSFALDYLGVEHENHRIVEWAIPSIIAYADAHSNDTTDYSKDLSKQDIAQDLYKMGVSADYNKPATLEQLSRFKEDKLRLVYNSIKRTNNLVDVSRVKGKDLDINDTNYEYIMTYSFPCQDLSVAGKRAGMKDQSTRSGLLWEVERILTELKELEQQGKSKMVNILIMENVPQIHSEQDLPHFIKWINRLEELGYQSYWEDLIATDYGIPQTRNRCFMVSIYGDYSYSFPKTKTLKLRLKDLLEKVVDEKYYLSKKQIEDIQGWNAYEKPLEKMEQTDKNEVSPTLTTRSGAYAAGMILVKEPKVLGGIGEKDSNGGTQWKQQNRIYDNDIAISVTTGFAPYYATEEYVGTYDYAQSDTLRPTQEDRLHIDKDVSGALLASGNHNGIVTIPLKRGYDCEVKQEQEDTDQIDVIGNYSKSNFTQTSIVGKNGVAPTVTENHGQVTSILTDNIRIRKLCPTECFRLMGVKDSDAKRIMKHQSDATSFHLAGDSIVVNCLMGLFSTFLDKNWEDYFKPKEWWNIES